ncbi:hypothetical protein FRC06_008344, partial [Ceratobasidium sp. 370]
MSASTAPSADAQPKDERTIDPRDDEAQEKQDEQDAENTDNWRPAEGPGARLPAPDEFAHTLFDPRIAHLRKIYTRIMLGSLVLTIVVMWICVPVF